MMVRYSIQTDRSIFTVQAFATGLLSFLGHSPTFAIRRFSGAMRFDGDAIDSMRLLVDIQADSLELLDQVSAADRRDIEERMRKDVLETGNYNDVLYDAGVASISKIAPGQHRLRLDGKLSLHGSAQPHQIDAELHVYEDAIRLRGQSQLKPSEFGIKPVTALGGTIKLKDELALTFDIAAVEEVS